MKCKNASMNSKHERAPADGLIEFHSPLWVGLAAAVTRESWEGEKGEEMAKENREDTKGAS